MKLKYDALEELAKSGARFHYSRSDVDAEVTPEVVVGLIADVRALAEALQGLDEAYCRAGADLDRDERTEDLKRLIAARAALSRIQENAE